jgi:hypothetical protein
MLCHEIDELCSGNMGFALKRKAARPALTCPPGLSNRYSEYVIEADRVHQ